MVRPLSHNNEDKRSAQVCINPLYQHTWVIHIEQTGADSDSDLDDDDSDEHRDLPPADPSSSYLCCTTPSPSAIYSELSNASSETAQSCHSVDSSQASRSHSREGSQNSYDAGMGEDCSQRSAFRVHSRATPPKKYSCSICPRAFQR